MMINFKSEQAVMNRPTRWSQERRLRFIDFKLQWDGRLNRRDLVEYFGVSMPQASLDISRYAELAQANLNYDPRTKNYVASYNFLAVYETSSAAQYLTEVQAIRTGIIDANVSFVGDGVDVDVAPVPLRSINEKAVISLVRAIREQRKLNVIYHSVSSGDSSSRQISPHAFGNDGFRWHVRAYCHRKNRFIDFVLARFIAIDDAGVSDIDSAEDLEWGNIVNLILAPNPELPESTRQALELDYGMINGQVEFPCRQAFLFYTLRRLGFSGAAKEEPVVQQIVLMNKDELEPLLRKQGFTREVS